MQPLNHEQLTNRLRSTLAAQRADLDRYKQRRDANMMIVRQREQFHDLVGQLLDSIEFMLDEQAQHYKRERTNMIALLDKFYLLYRISGLLVPAYETNIDSLWMVACYREGIDYEQTKRPSFAEVL